MPNKNKQLKRTVDDRDGQWPRRRREGGTREKKDRLDRFKYPGAVLRDRHDNKKKKDKSKETDGKKRSKKKRILSSSLCKKETRKQPLCTSKARCALLAFFFDFSFLFAWFQVRRWPQSKWIARVGQKTVLDCKCLAVPPRADRREGRVRTDALSKQGNSRRLLHTGRRPRSAGGPSDGRRRRGGEAEAGRENDEKGAGRLVGRGRKIKTRRSRLRG